MAGPLEKEGSEQRLPSRPQFDCRSCTGVSFWSRTLRLLDEPPVCVGFAGRPMRTEPEAPSPLPPAVRDGRDFWDIRIGYSRLPADANQMPRTHYGVVVHVAASPSQSVAPSTANLSDAQIPTGPNGLGDPLAASAAASSPRESSSGQSSAESGSSSAAAPVESQLRSGVAGGAGGSNRKERQQVLHDQAMGQVKQGLPTLEERQREQQQDEQLQLQLRLLRQSLAKKAIDSAVAENTSNSSNNKTEQQQQQQQLSVTLFERAIALRGAGTALARGMERQAGAMSQFVARTADGFGGKFFNFATATLRQLETLPPRALRFAAFWVADMIDPSKGQTQQRPPRRRPPPGNGAD